MMTKQTPAVATGSNSSSSSNSSSPTPAPGSIGSKPPGRTAEVVPAAGPAAGTHPASPHPASPIMATTAPGAGTGIGRLPVSVSMRQSIPFVKVPPSSAAADARTLPLFRDSAGLYHFLSGNQRGALWITLSLTDPRLPRFPVGTLGVGVVVRAWSNSSAQDGPSRLEPDMFDVCGTNVLDANTLCVRMNLRATMSTKFATTAGQLYFFHIRIEYGGVVLGVQTDFMRVLSKPRRLLVAGGRQDWTAAQVYEQWPSLRNLARDERLTGSPDTGSVFVQILDRRQCAAGHMPAGFETPLHRDLVLSMLEHCPTMERLVLLDFATAARCGHFVDSHIVQAHRDGLQVCLVPRRPRPDPVGWTHYTSTCISTQAGLSQAVEKLGVDAGTTHGESDLMSLVLQAASVAAPALSLLSAASMMLGPAPTPTSAMTVCAAVPPTTAVSTMLPSSTSVQLPSPTVTAQPPQPTPQQSLPQMPIGMSMPSMTSIPMSMAMHSMMPPAWMQAAAAGATMPYSHLMQYAAAAHMGTPTPYWFGAAGGPMDMPSLQSQAAMHQMAMAQQQWAFNNSEMAAGLRRSAFAALGGQQQGQQVHPLDPGAEVSLAKRQRISGAGSPHERHEAL